MQAKKQQLELDMQQQTGCKLGKEYIKAVYCHPAYLTYMQSTSCEMPAWMKHKLESRLPDCHINNLRYADDTTLMAESEEELNESDLSSFNNINTIFLKKIILLFFKLELKFLCEPEIKLPTSVG